MTIMFLLLAAVTVLFVLEVFVGDCPGDCHASGQPGPCGRLPPWEFLSWPAPLLLTTTGVLLLMAHPSQGVTVLRLAAALFLAGRLWWKRKGR